VRRFSPRSEKEKQVPPERKYATGLALRTALEERLKRIAREEGVDLQRLRRQVAFDRFLARLCPTATDWILKGGYAMELRFQTARATRDLDFTVRVAQAGRGNGLLKQLQDAGAKGAGDYLHYRIGEAIMELDGAPYGGARYPVESTMDERTFVKFHLDVGVGDVVLDPPEQANARLAWFRRHRRAGRSHDPARTAVRRKASRLYAAQDNSQQPCP